MNEAESDRDFMVRQARKLIEFNGGAGVQYFDAEEYTRIKEVWILAMPGSPVSHFSTQCYAEIMAVERRLAARVENARG